MEPGCAVSDGLRRPGAAAAGSGTAAGSAVGTTTPVHSLLAEPTEASRLMRRQVVPHEGREEQRARRLAQLGGLDAWNFR